MRARFRFIAGAVLVAGCVTPPRIDTTVTSTPQNVVRGYIPPGRTPVATVKSGDTVRVDTLSAR